VKNKTMLTSPAFRFNEHPFVHSLPYKYHKYNPNTTYEYYKSDENIDGRKNDITYRLNNYLLRSDDFSKEYSENNFLFAGCSQTVVLGLPLELGWAHQVNSYFDKPNYLNLAAVGLSIDTIISNVVHYIDIFGNPGAVFILFPDHFRITHVKKQEIITKWYQPYGSDVNTDIIDEANLKNYMSLKNLEVICESRGIPLAYSSWQQETAEVLMELKKQGVLKHAFDVYANTDIDLEKYSKKNSKYPHYWKIARDGIHFGQERNNFFADSFIKRIKELGL
jgi:hypothetical protein